MKFNVSIDLLIPVLLEIEANDADEALDEVYAMPKSELLELANTEEGSIAILDGSECVEEIVEQA